MAMPISSFEESMHRAIRAAVEDVVAKQATAAAVEVERKVRAMAAQIAANVCRQMDMQSYGDQLKITIHFPESKA